MNCTVLQALETEWKWIARHPEESVGDNSPAVILYWQMIEHRQNCQVCRDEDMARNQFFIVESF
jgi:hypothetical protein